MDEQKNAINIGDYIIPTDKILGKGSFGIVYEGYHRNNPKLHYAFKIIELCSNISESFHEKMKSLLDKELFALQTLKHPNFIEFIEAKTTGNHLYIITELCSEGDLSKQKGQISKAKILRYFRQLVEAMTYANSQGFFHRDLKPENILLKENSIKIADFGFAKFKEDPTVKSDNTCVGTPLYMAPEIYYGKPYSKKCDVWSAGILLYELFCDKTPWTGKGSPELFNNIKDKKLEFPEEIELSEDIKDLIKRMLKKDQDKRLDFDEVSKHKALQMKFENPIEDYFRYIRHLNQFIGKVAKEIEELREDLGFEKYFAKELAMVLTKYCMCNYWRLVQIIQGERKPDEDQINHEDFNEKNLKSLSRDYRKIYEQNHEKFKGILEEYEPKIKKFSASFVDAVLNENFEISSKFKKIYTKKFKAALKELVRRKRELLKEECDIKVLRCILKMIKIRKISAVLEEFAFVIGEENNEIFERFSGNMKLRDKGEMISVLKQIFKQLDKELNQ